MRVMLLLVSLVLILVTALALGKSCYEKHRRHKDLVKAMYMLDQQPPASGGK